MTAGRPNPSRRLPFSQGMGGTSRLRLVLALAAACLGACGHAAPSAGAPPDGLLTAPEPVQLPILADVPPQVPTEPGPARAAITLNAQGEFLVPVGPADDRHAPAWVRTRLDRSLDAAARRPRVVRCIRGALLDVILDLRPGSETLGRWHGVELSAENRRTLYVPRGFAHGFITPAHDTEAFYFVDSFHAAAAERGVRWDDPEFGIEWPLEPTVLSEKDRKHTDFDPAYHLGASV